MATRIAFSEVPKGLLSIMMVTENYLNNLGFKVKLIAIKPASITQ